jgi:uncharacterized protein YprB with RNaseH-like and TPR domain
MKVLFWDLESTDLARSFGHVLCGSFVELGEDKEPYTFRIDKKPWKGSDTIDDAKLAVSIRDELETADIIVGWNSILFDQRLLNTCLSLVGERYLQVGTKYSSFHLDLMYYARGSGLRIGSSKLDNVAKFFKCHNQKTPLDGFLWQRGAAGDKKAIDKIVEHCEADVMVLRDVYHHLVPLVSKIQFTLSEVYPFIEQIPTRKK